MSVAALVTGAAGSAHALGLGSLHITSGLGQQFRAQVDVAGADGTNFEPTCFKAKAETAEGAFLAPVMVTLSSRGSTRILILSTRQNLQEPAIKITVDMGCDIQLHREYMILLDPPQFAPAALRGEAAQALAPEAKTSAGDEQLPNGRGSGKERRVKRATARSQTESTAEPKRPDDGFSTRKAGRGKQTVPARDALKLSDEVTMSPRGLKLSESLSVAGGEQISENIDELRAAQAELAAFLRDESPDRSGGERLRAEQQRIQSLQQETGQLRRQSQIDKTALEELKESSFSRNWMIGLSAFVLACVAVIAMLLTYINRMHKKFASSWWQQAADKPEPVQSPNIEDLVDSVQASYGPTTVGALYAGYDRGYDSEYESEKELPESVPRDLSTATPALHSDSAADKAGSVRDSRRAYRSPSLEESNSSTFNFFSTRGQSVKVEEISDVTQEAEFWMSVNDPRRAIEILEPQTAIEHPDSPVPWLYLLDLYRVTGNKQKYGLLRDRFIVFFNANIPEFEVDPAANGSRQLEDFPHLIERICMLWGTSDALPFLESLLIDDRSGKRIGFELAVYRDILLLISISNEIERGKTLGGAWGKAPGVQAAVKMNDAADDPDSGMINFETIDFKKSK